MFAVVWCLLNSVFVTSTFSKTETISLMFVMSVKIITINKGSYRVVNISDNSFDVIICLLETSSLNENLVIYKK